MAKNPGNWFSNADEVLGKTQKLDSDGNIDGDMTTTSTITFLSGGNIAMLSGTTFTANQTVIFGSLPTSDPSILGQLWNDAGTLKVSAG